MLLHGIKRNRFVRGGDLGYGCMLEEGGSSLKYVLKTGGVHNVRFGQGSEENHASE